MKLTTGVDANISGQIVGKAVASCLTQEQIIVLAMKQYASPFMATFKELLSNALDAHHVAEVYSTPVDISVDEDVTTNTITFRFRDYGSGMSKEFLENYYFALGESTKRDDPRQTGSFGLGAKAGLIISPAMKVTTYDGEYSHTVIGQLVDGKQILCSELVSEPCAELRGSLVEFSVARSDTYCIAAKSAADRTKVIINGPIVEAIQRTAVVGYITQTDNAPRVRVTTNASYANLTTYSDHGLQEYYSRDHRDSLLQLVNKNEASCVRRGNLTVVPAAMLSTLPAFAEYGEDLHTWLWQDSFYKLADSLRNRINALTVKVDKDEVTLRGGAGYAFFWHIEPSVVFDISSDRSSINDTDRNFKIIAKCFRDSVTAVYRKLKDVEHEIIGDFVDVDPLGLEYRREIGKINLHRNMFKAFRNGVTADVGHELTEAMKTHYRFRSNWAVRSNAFSGRIRGVDYESKRGVHHGYEKLVPVVLVATEGKNKPVQELVRQALEVPPDDKTQYKTFMIRCPEGRADEYVAEAKSRLPKFIAVLNVDAEIETRGIDLTPVRNSRGKVAAKTRGKTSELVLWRKSSYGEPRDYAYAYSMNDDLVEMAASRRLATKEFTYVRVKGFDLTDGSRFYGTYDWNSLDSYSAAMGRQLLFLRSDVDTRSAIGNTGVKFVELGTYLINNYRTHIEGARQFRFFRHMTSLANYPGNWIEQLAEYGIDIRQLLQRHLGVNFDQTRIAQLLRWREDNKRSFTLSERRLANVLGFHTPIVESEAPMHWKADVYSSYALFSVLSNAIDKYWSAEAPRIARLRKKFSGCDLLDNLYRNYAVVLNASTNDHVISTVSVDRDVRHLIDLLKESSCSRFTVESSTDKLRQNIKGRKLLELALARYFAW